MKKLIRQLVENIYKKKHKIPSELFIEGLMVFSRRRETVSFDEEYLRILFKKKSYQAHLIYENLKKNKTILELAYVLLKLSDTASPLIFELTRNLKKASLGFKVSHFNDTSLALLRGRIENHLFEIVFQIYQHSCIYKALKESREHKSMAMQYFDKIVREELKSYEEQVVKQEEDLLSFYVGMYSSYLRLKVIHQIHECFKDNPKNPFEFIKSSFTSSQPFTLKIVEASARHLNNCLKQFVSCGTFEDEFCEFFIRKKEGKYEMSLWEYYVIEEGNIPYFISREIVEDTLYIGRCMGLLKWISTQEGLTEIQCICSLCLKKKPIEEQLKCFKEDLNRLLETSNSLDVLNKDLSSDINTLVNITNSIIEEAFIRKFSFWKYVEGIKNIFLCGRADFLETLFHKLKKIKKLTKRSYGYVLDTSIEETVGFKNVFYSTLDVFLHESSNSYDNFTLFSNIPFPVSVIITKEIVFDLSKIFKFLWIIKRTEHLLRRVKEISGVTEKIKIISYTNLLNRFYFYLFEELINPSFNKFFKTTKRMIVDVQMNLQQAIRNILRKMYIDYETKLFYRFIKQLEENLMNRIESNREFDDSDIKKILSSSKYETPNELIEGMIFDFTRIEM